MGGHDICLFALRLAPATCNAAMPCHPPCCGAPWLYGRLCLEVGPPERRKPREADDASLATLRFQGSRGLRPANAPFEYKATTLPIHLLGAASPPSVREDQKMVINRHATRAETRSRDRLGVAVVAASPSQTTHIHTCMRGAALVGSGSTTIVKWNRSLHRASTTDVCRGVCLTRLAADLDSRPLGRRVGAGASLSCVYASRRCLTQTSGSRAPAAR